ncbi:hypothetical protein P872_05745 [Rhodonellum psychrophilum GCM71 = DSM 17998]|uniref:Uncharacterized protein n=2 Tax=Rhodonellum TaxID=336827 RepID=U5C2W4_9BACT|nr:MULTISPECIES: hypothetical protein [Rhodonellum]ERM82527.1 hypothetical protein P872_05745 [Rhodonellum psychrophilum GCM71 = DSM 17998]MDO9552310.1 hypothetical protein [Rhodonellum sp.]SDY54595.1 hypothetical protein SAMN05444412_101488 [Rhodonellum ikkaensis]
MFSNIVSKIQSTSKLKQNLLVQVTDLFQLLEQSSLNLATKLTAACGPENQVPLKVEKINDYEFVFQAGEDVLVFILQSNIVRLSEETYLSKSKYLKSDPSLNYFGQILIYNFLGETIKNERLDDPGYLLGRLMVNRENKFFLEGDRKMVYHFPELQDNPVTGQKMQDFVELLVSAALDNDLLAPAFGDIMIITYLQKLEHTSGMGHPKKIGFDSFAKNRQ